MNSDSLNQRLILLVEEIKQYSANDCSRKIRVQRRIALNKFVNAVVNSGRLSKQTQWSRLPNYEDYHNEALQLTLIEICKKIDEYNPEYPVMAWVNKIFHWRFIDVVNKERKKGLTRIPRGERISPVLSLDDINKEINTETSIPRQEIVREIICKDPENYLVSQHLRGHSQANLQAILILLLEGQKWKEISQNLGVPLTTVSSFYQRRMHKIIDYLKKYI